MRHRLPTALGFLLLPCLAPAADAFKCTAADGSVSFQDHPCRAATRQEALRLPGYAPPPPVATTAPPEAGPALAPPPAAPAAAPAVPPPSFFLCTRFDGSRYASDIGIGGTSWVPYEAVMPNRGLASVYGPGGVGVSAPGLGEPPHATSPLAGTTYVQVDDECRRAAPQEACRWLRRELDDVRGKLRRAFSDTEADLKQRERELGERLRGC